jgi:hypothetical protein
MKTHILCPVTFFFRKSHSLWDNVEKCSGDWGATNDVTIWRIRFACWISKATSTHAHAHADAPGYPHACTRKHTHTGQYVILIAFPKQQWYRKHASVLLYTYIAPLVNLLSIAQSTVASSSSDDVFMLKQRASSWVSRLHCTYDTQRTKCGYYKTEFQPAVAASALKSTALFGWSNFLAQHYTHWCWISWIKQSESRDLWDAFGVW